MTKYELFSIIIGGTNLIVASVVAISTYLNSRQLKKLQEKNLKLNMAQTELYIQELLVNARKIFLDMTLERLKLSINNENTKQNDLNDSLIKHTLQEVLNSYEIACMKYLDDKVDKDRFKKTYIKEITDLFKTESYKKLLDETNSFQAIKKVNNEWNNLEN